MRDIRVRLKIAVQLNQKREINSIYKLEGGGGGRFRMARKTNNYA